MEMSAKKEYRCPYQGKKIITRDGEVIDSPCCRSNYCPRCCWYRKWKLMLRSPHHHLVVACYHTYMVLPYYKPIPSAVKKRVNKFFWDGLRRRYKQLAYAHSLEQQRGLLHGNWYVLSDTQIDPEFVLERWKRALLKHADIAFEKAHGSVAGVDNQKKVMQYLLKYGCKDPENYLPERGRYRKLYYTSPNWDEFIRKRCDETLLELIFEAQMLEQEDESRAGVSHGKG